MPLPGSVIRLVMQGTIQPGQSWSTGCYFADGTAHGNPPSQAELQQLVGTLGPGAQTWWASDPLNCQEVYLRSITAYAYGPTDPRTTDLATYTYPYDLPGQSSGNYNPAYTAMVGSLRTDRPGASYRGRMYMPATSEAVSTHMQWTQTQVQAAADALSALLEDWAGQVRAALPWPDANPVVASFTRSLITPITHVFVDSVPDTQHRREDKVGVVATGRAGVFG